MVHRLNEQAERLGDRPALWTKRASTWSPTSWRDYARKVKLFCLGLISLGIAPKQAIGILGFNREEWVVADLGAMAAGATPVGIYTTSSPEQLEYVIGHAEMPLVLVENAAALDKVLSVRARLPKLQHVVVMEAVARREGVLTYDEVLERGRAQDDAPYFERLEAARPDDLATLIYTSGTTGNPKGVMLTHHNVCWTTVQLSQATGLSDDEVLLSYLPLSHIAEQICSIYGPVHNAMQIYFAQSFEQLGENLKEVRPTVFFGVPRVWEKFKARAEAGLQTQPKSRQRVLAWARSTALRYHADALERRQMSIRLGAQYALARRLAFQPLKARIGFDRCHVFSTSAAPIGRDVLDFFTSIDVVIREVYGQSEGTGPTSVNSAVATRLGTLGRPLQGVEVRIADDGEILVRGGNVCAGYHKEPEATAELLEGGWLHSGDVGEFDGDGYLRITGRKKEIIVTSGGKKTPPASLELLLKGISPVGNAMVVGDKRNYLTAILALDPEKVATFAPARGWGLTGAELVARPEFKLWLSEQIEAQVNAKVARFEHIRKVEVLPHDFTVDGGELTSTLKVRRKVCEAKYAPLIEGMYAGGRVD
jgi:long-chain acyl-CoA synthetase